MKKTKPLTKVILLGRKDGAAKALLWLLRRGIEVPFVLTPKGQPLEAAARGARIPVFNDSKELYRRIATGHASVRGVDLVISYLFNERMLEPLITLGGLGCINFHPAPLPEYKSRAGYNTAILDKKKSFGVSAHFVDSEKFDAGPIIKVNRFAMDPKRETAWSLEKKTQPELFSLFTEVMNLFLNGKPIRTKPNNGGLYLTWKQLDVLREVLPSDSPAAVERKVRAFFFPPYSGAYIIVGDRRFELTSPESLQLLSEMFKK